MRTYELIYVYLHINVILCSVFQLDIKKFQGLRKSNLYYEAVQIQFGFTVVVTRSRRMQSVNEKHSFAGLLYHCVTYVQTLRVVTKY